MSNKLVSLKNLSKKSYFYLWKLCFDLIKFLTLISDPSLHEESANSSQGAVLDVETPKSSLRLPEASKEPLDFSNSFFGTPTVPKPSRSDGVIPLLGDASSDNNNIEGQGDSLDDSKGHVIEVDGRFPGWKEEMLIKNEVVLVTKIEGILVNFGSVFS